MSADEERLKAEIRALTAQTAKLNEELRSMLARTDDRTRGLRRSTAAPKATAVARTRPKSGGVKKR